jgi:hypothetical protein
LCAACNALRLRTELGAWDRPLLPLAAAQEDGNRGRVFPAGAVVDDAHDIVRRCPLVRARIRTVQPKVVLRDNAAVGTGEQKALAQGQQLTAVGVLLQQRLNQAQQEPDRAGRPLPAVGTDAHEQQSLLFHTAATVQEVKLHGTGAATVWHLHWA